MAPDDEVERRIQALLDGRELPAPDPAGPATPLDAPMRVVDAIGRAHRIALLGHDAVWDPEPITRWGHLEVRGEIGRGASGTVYRAWDPRLEREVALKLLEADRDTDEAALDEGRLLARLTHPHIVRVYGADTHDHRTGLWMELLDGDTLDEMLATDGVFSVEEALLIGLDLARALAAVHAAGLLHRDIKARNVLRERGGRIVLMDLGAGRAADATPGGAESGTPLYMAPEVLAGRDASVRSDIYSTGVLLFRLVTGTYPVTAEDLPSLRLAHGSGQRDSLRARRPEVEPQVAAVIERGCDPNPDGRFASAADFEEALLGALRRSAAARHVASSLSRTVARWRTATIGVALAAVTMAALGWLGWNTGVGRDARRAVGLAVPPRSALYLSLHGGLAILNGRRLSMVANNPATAGPLAASTDLGVRTMAGMPPYTTGAAYRLDGSPVAPPGGAITELCCFVDGTTDGDFNYAARQDSILLEPLGSRALAPPALYRFGRDWTHPEPLFPLTPEGLYTGISYASASDSFWLARAISDVVIVEQWSRAGRMLAAPITIPNANSTGIAVDPADGTLWVVRQQIGINRPRLENFDAAGRPLGAIDLELPVTGIVAVGAEFAWRAAP